jgi:hypothetical protein
MISTIIRANATQMWTELQIIGSLIRVASPILTFKSQPGQSLPVTWQIGHTYVLDLFAFHILPLGKHYIGIRQIDDANREIFTNEHGSLTRTWNHRIQIEPLTESTLRYTDEIEIEAGILTPFIWVFAHIFYRHRQRMWKELLSN